MNYLQKAFVWPKAVFGKFWACLDRPQVLLAAALLVPLGFGLLSWLMGQDDNWDLHNYHFYNPYALLNGKIGYDLAPAQWQSYFNPALDLLYYGLTQTLPAPAVGFCMGLLHGLNFILLLALARTLLATGTRLTLLLALAGSLGPGFLSELGNTMGDNMTSLCVLGALLMVLSHFEQLARGTARSQAIVAAAGLVMGIGAGLKLTNATYALALCLALLSLQGALWQRVRLAFVFGVGVLTGMAASAGFWYWKMWQTFGNPLFPQFNGWFHGPLAGSIGMGETGWLPKNWFEKLFWPFIFTLHPKRVIEIALTQLIWPMLYAGFVALALQQIYAKLQAAPITSRMASRTRFLLIFFALSYVIWLNLFSLYRYLIPLELLAPLTFWLIVESLTRANFARQLAGCGLLLATLVIFPFATWGHADWNRNSVTAELPELNRPEQNIVFTVHGDPPMGWLVPSFPASLAFVALGSGFPESQGYRDRVNTMMASRSGPFYVMLQADRNDPANIRSEPEQRKAALHNRDVLDKAREVLGRYGLVLNADSCTTYPAFVGKTRWSYQFCTVIRK